MWNDWSKYLAIVAVLLVILIVKAVLNTYRHMRGLYRERDTQIKQQNENRLKGKKR